MKSNVGKAMKASGWMASAPVGGRMPPADAPFNLALSASRGEGIRLRGRGRHLSGETLLWVLMLLNLLPVSAATLIYRTGFEGFEGYTTNAPLSGQNNWVHEGTGGNGIVTNFIPGAGQSAFIGFTPPDATEFFNVWRPVNLAPVPTNLAVLTFSVTMLVADSTSTNRDDFRWSIYNTNGARLFTLDFDNSTTGINYNLDDAQGFVATGYQFTRGAVHELAITMNIRRNRWMAALDGVSLTAPLPLTTKTNALNLGDIDAVWAIRTVGKAGDNYLVFDNYQISGEAPVGVPAVLAVTRQIDGQLRFQVQAEQATSNAIEVSTNLTQWTSLATNSAPDGAFDVLDAAPLPLPRRFYRVRLAEP